MSPAALPRHPLVSSWVVTAVSLTGIGFTYKTLSSVKILNPVPRSKHYSAVRLTLYHAPALHFLFASSPTNKSLSTRQKSLSLSNIKPPGFSSTTSIQSSKGAPFLPLCNIYIYIFFVVFFFGFLVGVRISFTRFL